MYHYLKADKEMIVNGYRAAGISEAIENVYDITQKTENYFKKTSVFLTLTFLKGKTEK